MRKKDVVDPRFRKLVEAGLRERGATDAPKDEPWYAYLLDTKLGPLEVTVHSIGVECHFRDVDRARKGLKDRVAPWTGRWYLGWHSFPGPEEGKNLLTTIDEVLEP